MKNSDASAVLVYWTLEGPQNRGAVLGNLALAPGGAHRLAPGERVKVSLPAGTNLVGTFVPWQEGPTLTTVLDGGFVLASEVPTKGTLLVDRKSFVAANRGRGFRATLQEWGLEVPRLVLDGRSDDWKGVSPLVEWGPVFSPPGTWPPGWPRLLALQVLDEDGALWLRLTFEPKPVPRGESASLVLGRPGASLEWPWTGTDPRVWFWGSDSEPAEVGSRVLADGVIEAWVPWDRMAAADHRTWLSQPAVWSLVVTGPGGTKAYELAPFSGEDVR